MARWVKIRGTADPREAPKGVVLPGDVAAKARIKCRGRQANLYKSYHCQINIVVVCLFRNQDTWVRFPNLARNAPLAQWLARNLGKIEVLGSIPKGGSIISN